MLLHSLNLKMIMALALLIVLGPVPASQAYPIDEVESDAVHDFQGDCTVICFIPMDQCTSAQHVAWPDYDYHRRGAGSHWGCWSGQCAAKHPTCIQWIAEGELAKLERALAEENVGLLEKQIRNSSTIRLNEARGSIQVVGCQGLVVANFPLGASVATALETSLDASP